MFLNLNCTILLVLFCCTLYTVAHCVYFSAVILWYAQGITYVVYGNQDLYSVDIQYIIHTRSYLNYIC